MVVHSAANPASRDFTSFNLLITVKMVVPTCGSLLVIFTERSKALPLSWCDQFLHVRFKTIGLRYHVELFT